MPAQEQKKMDSITLGNLKDGELRDFGRTIQFSLAIFQMISSLQILNSKSPGNPRDFLNFTF